MAEVLLCTHCPFRRFALQSYYLGVSVNLVAGMPFHLVAEHLATVPHLSYTQVNTVGQPTARTELVHTINSRRGWEKTVFSPSLCWFFEYYTDHVGNSRKPSG